MDTAFTRLVGCAVPLQQAGMGGTASAELAVAVANAGALGMLGMPTAPAPEFEAVLQSVRNRTSSGPGAFGVHFLVPFLDRDAAEVAAGVARVVEFFYGDPDPSLVALAHEGGALASWQVGSVDEARSAADSGCDLVVAQGCEAGGHVRGRVGMLALVELVLDAVDVPVLAAGGIGSPRAMAAVLAAGASGARIGTRFVAADEADTHPAYADALAGAQPEDTVVTTTFGRRGPTRRTGCCGRASTRPTTSTTTWRATWSFPTGAALPCRGFPHPLRAGTPPAASTPWRSMQASPWRTSTAANPPRTSCASLPLAPKSSWRNGGDAAHREPSSS